MKNLILTTLLVLVCLAARAQKVTSLSATAPIAGGATYFLPQVGLVVNVPIMTTTFTFGPDLIGCGGVGSFHFKTDVREALNAHIEPYLNKDYVDHMDIKPHKTYELGTVTMNPKSIRDPNKGFRMHVAKRGRKATFQYDENDFLVSGNVENNNDVLPLILKAVDVGVSSLKSLGPLLFSFMKSDESAKPDPVKLPCQTIRTINKLGEVKNTLLLKSDVAGGGLTQQLEAIDRQIQLYTDRIMKVTEKMETISFFVLPEPAWLVCKCDKYLFSYDPEINVLTVNSSLSPRILTEKYNDERVRVGVVNDGYKLVIKALPGESITAMFRGEMDPAYKGLAYNIPEKCNVFVQKGLFFFANQYAAPQ